MGVAYRCNQRYYVYPSAATYIRQLLRTSVYAERNVGVV